MADPLADLIGGFIESEFKGVVEKVLQPYVDKGLITQQDAGEMTAGLEDGLKLGLALYQQNKTPPA